MENNQPQVTAEEFTELNSIPTVYTNRTYFMINNGSIKIVMCEKATNIEDTKARASVCMTMQDFFAFSDLIKANRDSIDAQIKAAQNG